MANLGRLNAPLPPSFPRYFRIAGHWVNSYKIFLCIGVYLGILVSAGVGERSGHSPLRLGAGLLLFAIIGMIGARLYHLAVHLGAYRTAGVPLTARRSMQGGWSVLGGLVIVPLSLLFDSIFGIPVAILWDHAAIAIAIGGAWVRFGCICNGCCVGRQSNQWFALRQHDVHGVYERRIPAQWFEIAWWLVAWAGLIWLWPKQLPTGSYAFAILGWYGLGRVWLEPLRQRSDLLFGIRVNQVVAALMTVLAGAGLVWRIL
jgi:phosphatidylglycerol---prolipoprotein diacylglyceryl transferase